MTPDNYAFLARELLRRSGLSMGPDKAYLAETRLMPIATRNGLASADALVGAWRAGGSERLAREARDAMMTHESFFFRDGRPFEQFQRGVLPGLLDRPGNARRLRIWCAAASTGQEPYSLAMILCEEAARLKGWSVELVATDISPVALTYAREGHYTQFEVQRGLPIPMLARYFVQEGSGWRVRKEVRSIVSFREFNLLDDPAALGTFDVVFCRNVLIYFDQETKARVLTRIARQLASDGCLFLGGSETVIGLDTPFTPHPQQRGIFLPHARTAPIAAPRMASAAA